ncbi:MAG: CRISPR-associated endonuclease Cas1 [Planctomycetes bacterium]|nr:CRISPR-associated endonuclease Cas1 [Planctomycetota bacterium]
MLNEFAYCPRLFHLMHVEGRWEENVYTFQGKTVHRRLERFEDLLPEAPAEAKPAQEPKEADKGDEAPKVSRSVSLTSERLGITGKLDLVATEGDEAIPVDTKRGRPPDNHERSWEPERVQLMAQGLLLREHGYKCERGVIYFAESKTRVDVPFTPDLEARTLALIGEARLQAARSELPEPLEDSPKCNGCSLNGICLPDETLALRCVPQDPVAPSVRRLYPVRDDAVPLYVQEQGAVVGKSRETLVVRKQGEELARVRLMDISQLVVCGNVMVTAQTVHLLCEAGVPVVHLSMGHYFYGVTSGIHLRNSFDRAAQFAAAESPDRRLALARAIVLAKCANQRTMLRRNAGSQAAAALEGMEALIGRVPGESDLEVLLGLEGQIAHHYFRCFHLLLKPRDFEADWEFNQRNRRPPRDPVNALLSFGYALLAKECTVALLSEGLDPWWGLYHRPRHGRPGLALDLMEEFRPVIVDSVVVTAVNTGMVSAADFRRTESACMLSPEGRKAFLRAYEGRLDQLVTHPIFGYKCSWRQTVRLQARLLARWLRGDVPAYHGMTTR